MWILCQTNNTFLNLSLDLSQERQYKSPPPPVTVSAIARIILYYQRLAYDNGLGEVRVMDLEGSVVTGKSQDDIAK